MIETLVVDKTDGAPRRRAGSILVEVVMVIMLIALLASLVVH